MVENDHPNRRLTPGYGTLLLFVVGVAYSILLLVGGVSLISTGAGPREGLLALGFGVVLAPLCVWGIVKGHRGGQAPAASDADPRDDP